MSLPFWFRLLRIWCLEGGTGLTLPFIVGADARARGTSAKPEDVRRILKEIQGYESPKGSVVVRWCPHRAALVFGAFPFGCGRLEIDPALVQGRTTETQLLEQLAQVAETRVQAGDFSRVGIPATWAPFQHHDLEFVDRVIAMRA